MYTGLGIFWNWEDNRSEFPKFIDHGTFKNVKIKYMRCIVSVWI